MEPLTLLAWIIAITVVAAALYAVESRDLLSAVIAAGVVDLAAALVFLMLQAPDVAITQASIGAGITVAVFVYAIRRTERWES